MAAITNILFDLGKVLIDFDHCPAAEKLASFTQKSPDTLIESFLRSKLAKDFEVGKIEPEAFYGKIKSRMRIKLPYEQFVPIWNEIFFLTDANREALKVARALREKYTVAILSNTNILHLEYIRRQYDIFGAFNRVFASCELGHMKPDPRIYSLALKALGATPAQTFYTDDRPDFIERARTMGLRAYQFTTPEQLKKDLRRCGIEIPL